MIPIAVVRQAGSKASTVSSLAGHKSSHILSDFLSTVDEYPAGAARGGEQNWVAFRMGRDPALKRPGQPPGRRGGGKWVRFGRAPPSSSFLGGLPLFPI